MDISRSFSVRYFSSKPQVLSKYGFVIYFSVAFIFLDQVGRDVIAQPPRETDLVKNYLEK